MDTTEFLKELYRNIPHGYAEIRLIPAVRGKGSYIKQWYRPMPFTDFNQHSTERLHALNANYHIYHRMAISMAQASEKSDITMLPALWLDVDDCSTDSYNALLAMDCYPNIIVHSGGGFHAYWLLIYPVTTDSERAWFEIERTMEGMIVAVGGEVDPKAKDITRVLRTPGFYNIKPEYSEKRLCRVVFFDDARYSFETLHNRYAPLGKPRMPQITRSMPDYTPDVDLLPNRVKNFIQHGVVNGKGRNTELYYCARAYLDAGLSQSQAEQDLVPVVTRIAGKHTFTEQEAIRTIASAYRNTPNPAQVNYTRKRIAISDKLGGAK